MFALLACSLVGEAVQASASLRTCAVNRMAGVKDLATPQMAKLFARVGKRTISSIAVLTQLATTPCVRKCYLSYSISMS